MSVEQLFEKLARLRQELSDAYVAEVWQCNVIDRLAHDIGEVERALGRALSRDGREAASTYPARE